MSNFYCPTFVEKLDIGPQAPPPSRTRRSGWPAALHSSRATFPAPRFGRGAPAGASMVPPSPPPSVVILFFSTFDTAVLACAGNSEFSRKFPWRLVYIFFQGEARGKKKDTGLPNQVRFAVNTLEPRVPALARRSWLGPKKWRVSLFFEGGLSFVCTFACRAHPLQTRSWLLHFAKEWRGFLPARIALPRRWCMHVACFVQLSIYAQRKNTETKRQRGEPPTDGHSQADADAYSARARVADAVSTPYPHGPGGATAGARTNVAIPASGSKGPVVSPVNVTGAVVMPSTAPRVHAKVLFRCVLLFSAALVTRAHDCSPGVCGKGCDHIPLAVLILSSPHAKVARQATRQAWAHHTAACSPVRYWFVLGNSLRGARVAGEDMLHVDAPEGYGNISLKVIAGLRWLVRQPFSFANVLKVRSAAKPI